MRYVRAYFFVNEQALPLLNIKISITKWKLHFVSCNFGLKSNFKFCNHVFDFRSNCTQISALSVLNLYDIFLGFVKLRYSTISQTVPKVHIRIRARQNHNIDVLVNIKDETIRLTTNPE